MFKVVTIDEMRAIEAASDADGFTYSQMLEQAGRAAADRALQHLQAIDEPRITILVGTGNNGGDGLVAGLFIAQDNPDAEVRFYLLKDRDDTYIQTARDAGLFVALAEDDSDKRVLRNMVASADLVLDALFGIGVRLPIRDEAQRILRNTQRAINERRNAEPDTVNVTLDAIDQFPRAPKQTVLAIDVPSGLNADTGAVDSNTIAADETITFIAAKRGLFDFPGAATVGKVTVADIGMNTKLAPYHDIQHHVSDAHRVADLLPKRPADAHKGTFGKAMIVAGSLNYVGAAALASAAAYRSGAGLVTVGAPSNVIAALAGRLQEATWLMLPHNMGVIAESAADLLRKELTGYSSLLIGPGIGTEKTTREFLQTLLQEPEAIHKSSKRRLGFQTAPEAATDEDSDAPSILPSLVVDADGLNLLAEIDEWWTLLPDATIITPHPGEMARLAKLETSEVQSNRVELALEKAAAWNVILVLKGAHTLIAHPDGRLTYNPFKSDALSTAGTGDVLAGLITGLLAQGTAPYDAAIAACYLHGLAGDVAAASQSTRSVMAGDVLTALGEAFAQIDR